MQLFTNLSEAHEIFGSCLTVSNEMDGGTVATSPMHTSPSNGQLTSSPVANRVPSGSQMHAGRLLTSADVTAITEAGSKGGVFMVIIIYIRFLICLLPIGIEA